MKPKKTFDVVQNIKENARREVGGIPPTKLIPHKNKKVSKHPKRDLEMEIE
jgi:hypothetical protein